MFERFTDRARRVVAIAQGEARDLGHAYLGTEHFLLGMLAEGGGVAAKALERLELDLDEARTLVKEMIPTGDTPSGHIPFTPGAKKLIETSLREALQLGHNYIGTEHLLLALIRFDDCQGVQVLLRMGAEPHQVRQATIALLTGYEPPQPVLTPPILPEPFVAPTDQEDLAVTMISGLLAGEHLQARRILEGLRSLGWRPPSVR